MKKLIVALVVAAFAVVSQAASVQWNVSNIYKDATTKAGTSDGFMVYLISDATYAQADAASALAGGTLTKSIIESKAIASSGLTSEGKVSKAGTDLGALADGEYQFYSVIVNGDNAVVGDKVTATIVSVGTPSMGNFNAKTLTTNSANWKPVSGGGGGGDIPEPTSGLLLLVGGAMLALRRKQK